MSDHPLRDRIAAAITGCDYNQKWCQVGPYSAGEFADAVIAKLGLREEQGELYPGGSTKTRYVTEWEGWWLP